MLKREYRLKKRIAFAATYKIGNAYHRGGITMFCGKMKPAEGANLITKIGFVVSKKNHKRAVKRNRMKRLMREAVRLYIKSKNNDFNTKYLSLIFIGSSKLIDKDFDYINKNINELLGMINND